MSGTTQNYNVCVGANERAEVMLQLLDGRCVVQSIMFSPDEADSVAVELRKFAALTRAKREGAAGSA
jgi:hypothetical protein